HLADGTAREVHERLGLDQQHLLAALHDLGHLGREARGEPCRGARPTGHGVHDVEPDVVSGAGGLFAGGPPADGDAHGGCYFSSSSPSALALRMTSGSAPSVGAASTGSGAALASRTWTTTRSPSSRAVTPAGSVSSLTWMAWPTCSSPMLT